MVLIFSTPLNLGLESSCIERGPCPHSLLLSHPSLPKAQPQAKGPVMGLGIVAGGRVNRLAGEGRAEASEEEWEG